MKRLPQSVGSPSPIFKGGARGRSAAVACLLLLAAVAASLSTLWPSHAANTCTWTGAAGTDWTNAGNWTSCSSTTPQAADAAVINSAANQPTINTNVNIAALTLNTGATLTVGSNTLTVNGNIALNADGGATTTINNSGTLTQTAGTTSTARSNAGGTANINLSGTGGWNLNDFTTNTNTTTTLADGATYAVAGDITRSGGTLAPGTSTVTMTGSGKQLKGSNVHSFYNLVINGGASVTNSTSGANVTIGKDLTVAGTFTQASTNGTTFNFSGTSNLTGGGSITFGGVTVQGNTGTTLNAGSQSFAVVGAFSVSGGGTFNGGTATVTFNGSAAQSLGGAGTKAFRNLTVNNSSGVTLGAAASVSGTLTLAGGAFANGANLSLGNGATISRDAGSLASAPTFGTSVNLFYTGATAVTTGNEVPAAAGVLNNMTVDKSGGVTLGSNASAAGVVTVTSGSLDQGASFNLTAGTVSIAGGATLRNLGAGDLTLGPGGVSNSGTVNFNGNGTPCGGADDILIRSTVDGTQRTWSGSGTFSLTDVDVKDQRVPGAPNPPLAIIANSSTDSGDNTGWTFTGDGACASGSYKWVGGLNANWQDPTSWSPARVTRNTADVLTFDGAVTPGPTVNNFITETDASLQIVNGADVKLNASSAGAPQTLTLSGGPGLALGVQSGSRLTLQGSSALRIDIASGSSGTVAGGVTFEGGAHRLRGSSPAAVTFLGGATFGTNTDFTGNPFGTGASGDGGAGSVVFASDSDYFHNGGESPFGTAGGSAVVVFQAGSRATWLTSSGFQASGRTYADLIVGKLDPGGLAVSVSDAGSGTFQFDSLTVRSTDTSNSSLSFLGNGASAVNVRGDIKSEGAGSGTLADVTLGGGTGGIVVSKSGGGTVNFTTAGNTRSVDFEGDATVASGTTLALGRILQAGINLSNGYVVSVEGALTGSASGYVIGKLRRQLAGTGTTAFEVGSANGYSPVTLNVTANSNASPAPFTVSAAGSYMTGVAVQSKAVRRTYALTNGGGANALTADVTFQYVSTPTTSGGDVTPGVDVNTLDAYRRDSAGNIVKFPASSRGANTVTVTGVNSFSEWTLANAGAAPTLARLQSFRATSYAGGAVLEWHTSYELDNLGFNVYRQAGGRLVRVNPSLVAGSALSAGPGTALTAGNSYAWLDAEGRAGARYWLEEVDIDGRATMRGPFPAAAGRGAVPSVHRSLLAGQVGAADSKQADSGQHEFIAPAEGLSLEGSGVEGSKSVRRPSVAARPRPANALERQREIASGPAVKLLVRESGWYRVTRDELLAAGLRAGASLYDLRLYVEGVEVPLYVNAPDASAAVGAVEFYGTGLDTPSTDARVYWLVESRPNLRRPILPRPGGVLSAPGEEGDNDAADNASAGEAAAGGVTAGEAEAGAAEVAPRPETPNDGTRGLGVPRSELPDFDAPESSTDKGRAGSPSLRPGARSALNSGAQPSSNSGAQASAGRASSQASSQSSSNSAVRPSTSDAPRAVSEGPESYAYTAERRDRTAYFASVLNGDEENFFGRYIGPTPDTQTLTARNVSRPGLTGGTLEVSVQGLTTGAHRVRVVLNGTELGALSFAGRVKAAASFDVEPSLLREGDNEVQLTSSGNSDACFTDYLRLTYRHRFRADEDRLRFPAPAASAPLRVTGFTTENVRVVDVTNPDEAAPVAALVEPDGEGGWAVVVPPSTRGRTLYAFADARVSKVAAALPNSPSRLTAGAEGADFVVITNGEFRQAVEPLAAKRAAEGLTVSVVDVEDLYDEFSYGAHTPQAVRDFLAWADSNWTRAPRYVLLVGDGSYDPRGRLGQGAFDLMPAKLVDAGTFETASDDWFADFDGDGAADLPVGRLPVRTRAEAEAVVRKIVAYEPGSTEPTALLVADRAGADGYNFESATAELTTLLPANVSAARINRGAQDAAAVKSQIIAGINAGPLVVNWMGHGSTDVWTGDAILSSADAASLANGGRLPVFVMMTCLNGYYVGPAQESLAESLLKAGGGGALAVWASTGLTEPGGQAEANRELYRALFAAPGVRLGDAVRDAKAATSDRDVRRTWVLFGDPTVRVR